jgi:hypothetical protein
VLARGTKVSLFGDDRLRWWSANTACPSGLFGLVAVSPIEPPGSDMDFGIFIVKRTT